MDNFGDDLEMLFYIITGVVLVGGLIAGAAIVGFIWWVMS